MKRVVIFYCKRIKDHTCIACAKCFKGVREKAGEFEKLEDTVEIAAMTDCGDCPGLLVPRAPMIVGLVENLGAKVDAIYLGTCVKMAYEHGNCPMELDDIKLVLEQKFNVPVYIGTHPYV
ncbi:MAG: CGGC domain-containing protein [Acidobacteriota bacterium]|jgi:predicted metal-binding protein